MNLIPPSIEYKDSYIEAMREFEQEGAKGSYANTDFPLMESDFARFVTEEIEKAQGKHLLEGWVPSTTLWLVDGDTFIGSIRIRHRLTETLLHVGGHIGYGIRPSERNKGYGNKILELALPYVRELGIDRALVTCRVWNTASRKIIEHNGGVFENQVTSPDGGADSLRFWMSVV
jgi:predicted acetyltransferase